MHELIKEGNYVPRDVSILSKNINAKICWRFVRRIFFCCSANKIFLVKVKDAMNIGATYSSKTGMPALRSVSLCSDCTRRRTGIEVVEAFCLLLFNFFKSYKTELCIPPIDELKHAINPHPCSLA